jgi:hypothetical protein
MSQRLDDIVNVGRCVWGHVGCKGGCCSFIYISKISEIYIGSSRNTRGLESKWVEAETG